ncbi:hypothetical protein LEMLEM_LOCUS15449, partial [Lemmus lemmus]
MSGPSSQPLMDQSDLMHCSGQCSSWVDSPMELHTGLAQNSAILVEEENQGSTRLDASPGHAVCQ